MTTPHSNHNKDRLCARFTAVLDRETTTGLVEELDRLAQVPAFLSLLDELEKQSAKVARVAVEALPDLKARAGLAEASMWLDLCVAMAQCSGATALKFVKESPWLLAMLDGHDLRVQVLNRALECAERDGNVALEFVRVAPELWRHLREVDVTSLTEIGFELAERDYVLGLEFFRECPKIVDILPLEDVRSWIEFGLRLISINQFGKTDYFATLEYMRMSPALLKTVSDVPSRRLVLQLGATMAAQERQIAMELMAEAPVLLQRIDDATWQRRMLQYSLLVADRDAESARQYLRRCPEVVGWLGYDEGARRAFEEWFKNGMEILAYSVEGARAFFALETRKAVRSLQEAQSGVPLRHVARSLKLFVQALCGRDISVQELPDEKQPHKQTVRATVSADGRTLYLPSIVRRHAEYDRNVRLYTVMAAHEAGHLEFGTYDLQVDELLDLIQSVGRRYGAGQEIEPSSLADLFALYPQPGVIRDLWTVLEDARVEQQLRAHYPGLRQDLETVTREAVTTRSLSQGMSVREMLLDGLLIRSAAIPDVTMPDALRDPLSRAWSLCEPVLASKATAADAVRVADRVYVAFDEMLNSYSSPDEPRPPTAGESEQRVNEGPQASETIEDAYHPLENWSFRGGMNPEFIGSGEAGIPSTGLRREAHAGQRERSPVTSSKPAQKQGDVGSVGETALSGADSAPHPAADEMAAVGDSRRARWQPQAGDRGHFHYDEWDGMLRDYRSRWCRVIEQSQTVQNADFVEEVLRHYGPSVTLLRRYFESIRPPALRSVRGVADGDEIDLDAAVTLRADLAAGADPSDRVYMRRERRERDVAVAFLVDLSGSTSRRIDSDGRRVIDVEKAGLVLLCEALEAVGDRYAIYGFSGKGRDQVDVLVVKDFGTTNRTETVARIGALEPMHQNRDGAAIRHATSKLVATGARVKLLVLISDGKPLDEGYAEEYALEDTKMALREAAGRGVDPFCITVDHDAEEYVRRMYGDVRYLVIDRAGGLPERLPRVYHHLTK